MLLYSVLRCVQIFATPRSVSCQAPLSSTVSWSLLKFMFIELVMLSNHLILCYTLLLLPSIFPSTRVFPSESAFCIRWPKYWSFSFSISLSNKYSVLISFRKETATTSVFLPGKSHGQRSLLICPKRKFYQLQVILISPPPSHNLLLNLLSNCIQ